MRFGVFHGFHFHLHRIVICGKCCSPWSAAKRTTECFAESWNKIWNDTWHCVKIKTKNKNQIQMCLGHYTNSRAHIEHESPNQFFCIFSPKMFSLRSSLHLSEHPVSNVQLDLTTEGRSLQNSSRNKCTYIRCRNLCFNANKYELHICYWRSLKPSNEQGFVILKLLLNEEYGISWTPGKVTFSRKQVDNKQYIYMPPWTS